MTTITLESIKAEQTKIAAMIATFEAQSGVSFPLVVAKPELNEGERYVGLIVSADGAKRHHIILLPGESGAAAPHQEQTKWAASIGGELPDRCESALLFATMKDEFKPEAYWTRELDGSEYAWYQTFYYGYQDRNYLVTKLRARAVRRLEI